MDIHSAMMHMHSVKSYIENLNASDAKVYSKTKKKLTDLSSDMLQCVRMISEILNETALDNDETGILSHTTQEIDSDILRLSEDMSNTVSKFEELDHFNHILPTLDDFDVDVFEQDSDDYVLPVTPVSAIANTTVKQRKYVVKTYGDVLKILPSRLTNYPDAKLCAELISRWYRIRFFESQTGNYYYNIKNIPMWVRNIVLAFGTHLEHGTIDKFCTDFDGWLSAIQQPESKQSKYSVPYDVYALGITIKKSDVSLTSVVLWEILYDNGMKALSNSKLEDCSLQSETMYNLCTKYDPSIMEQYEYYQDSKSIGNGG